MKYLIAVLIPPVAVIGCGMVLSGILNAILWAAAGVLLLSSLVWFLFFGTPVVLLVAMALVLWVAASTHAVFVVRSHLETTCREEEEMLLMQQLDLMRRAAAARASPPRREPRSSGATVETKSGLNNGALETMRAENPEIEKIFQDELWLEGERRGYAVKPDDPVVSARVAEIIRARARDGAKQKSDS
jgi:uncharacterized membrane protein YqaE (UPF0057 family)